MLNSGFDEIEETENSDYFESEENSASMTRSLNDFEETDNSQEHTK